MSTGAAGCGAEFRGINSNYVCRQLTKCGNSFYCEFYKENLTTNNKNNFPVRLKQCTDEANKNAENYLANQKKYNPSFREI